MRDPVHVLGVALALLFFVVIVVGAVLMAGCAAPIPGDGTLVLIKTDSAIADLTVSLPGAHSFSTAPFGIFVQRGVRYWDQVGARLRTEEQIGADDVIDASTPVLRIVAAGSEESGDTTGGWYSLVDGEIHIPVPMSVGGDVNLYQSIIAHEVGHALGLHHVTTPLDGNCAIMNPSGCERGDLGPDDIKQFFDLWPNHRP